MDLFFKCVKLTFFSFCQKIIDIRNSNGTQIAETISWKDYFKKRNESSTVGKQKEGLRFCPVHAKPDLIF